MRVAIVQNKEGNLTIVTNIPKETIEAFKDTAKTRHKKVLVIAESIAEAIQVFRRMIEKNQL